MIAAKSGACLILPTQNLCVLRNTCEIGHEQLELGVAVPHLDLCALPRVARRTGSARDASPRCSGRSPSTRAARGRRRARGPATARAGSSGGTPAVWCADVRDQHLDRVVRHALLGQEDANPSRIRRAGVVVQQHARDCTATKAAALRGSRTIGGMRIVAVLCLVASASRLQEQERRRCRAGSRCHQGAAGADRPPRRAARSSDRSCRARPTSSISEIKDAQAKRRRRDRAGQGEGRAREADRDARQSDFSELSTQARCRSRSSGDKAAQIACARGRDGQPREARSPNARPRLPIASAALAQRDSEAAQRWKDSCTIGAAPVIIQS